MKTETPSPKLYDVAGSERGVGHSFFGTLLRKEGRTIERIQRRSYRAGSIALSTILAFSCTPVAYAGELTSGADPDPVPVTEVLENDESLPADDNQAEEGGVLEKDITGGVDVPEVLDAAPGSESSHDDLAGSESASDADADSVSSVETYSDDAGLDMSGKTVWNNSWPPEETIPGIDPYQGFEAFDWQAYCVFGNVIAVSWSDMVTGEKLDVLEFRSISSSGSFTGLASEFKNIWECFNAGNWRSGLKAVVSEGVTSLPAGFMPAKLSYNDYPEDLVLSLPRSLTTIEPGAFRVDISTVTFDDKSGLYQDGVLWGNEDKSVLVQSTQKEGDVVIPEGVQTVGANAFLGSGYEKLTIPASLTSISKDSFPKVAEFSSVEVAEGNTQFYLNDDLDSPNYGQLCQKNAQGEEEVVLAVNVPLVTDESGVAYNDDGTAIIGFTKAFTSDSYTVKDTCVEIADGAFDGCTTLKSITGKNVETIGSRAFDGCSSLASVDMPQVSSLGSSAFGGCAALKGVSFPLATALPSGVFYGCSSLTGYDVSKVTSIGSSAFSGTALTEFTAPSAIGSLDSSTFSGCTKLKKADLSALTMEGIPPRLFEGCTSLTEFVWPKGATSIEERAFAGCGLVSFDFSSIKKIGKEAFQGCASLTSVTLPSGIQFPTIGSAAFFSDCTALASVDLSNTGLTSLPGNMFSGCTSLTSVKLPSGLKTIDMRVFQNCTSLETIVLPGGLKTISNYAFDGCTSLKNLTLPDSITDIKAAAFNNTPVLIKFTLPGSLWAGVSSDTWSKDSDGIWGTGALFTGTEAATLGKPEADWIAKTSWSSVKEVDISKYGNDYLPPYLFMGLNQLEEVVIPAKIRTVMEGAFMGCTSLKDVYCFNQDIQFVVSEGTTGDSSLGWTSKTFPSFAAWKMDAFGKAKVEALTGINFYGLAYSTNKLVEYCQITGNTFIPFVVLENNDSESLFGYPVTGYNTVSVDDLVYTGKELAPQVTVSFTDRQGIAARVLDASDCQSLTYRDASGNVVSSVVNPGTYTVEIVGDGKSVFGSQKATFKVVAPPAADVPVSGNVAGMEVSGSLWGAGIAEAYNPAVQNHTTEVRATHVASGDAYNAIMARKGAGEMAGVFKLELLVDGTNVYDRFGSLTVKLPVGVAYNGRQATVWHVHEDGTVTSEAATVADGFVTVTLTDLSTLGVEIAPVVGTGTGAPQQQTGAPVQQQAAVQQGGAIAQTGDAVDTAPLVALVTAALGALGLTGFAARRRQQR